MSESGSQFLPGLCIVGLLIASGCARSPAPRGASAPTRPSGGQLQEALQHATAQLKPFCSQQTSCALTTFQERSVGASQAGEYLADKLTTAMSNAGLSLVERSRLHSAIDELKISGRGLISDSTAKTIGALVGADTIIVGTLTIDADLLELHTRAIDSESGKIVKTHDLQFPLMAMPSGLIGKKVIHRHTPSPASAPTKLASRSPAPTPPVAQPSSTPVGKIAPAEPPIAYEADLRSALSGMAAYIGRVQAQLPTLGFATTNGSILLGARLQTGDDARLIHGFSGRRTYVILGQANDASASVGLRVLGSDGRVIEAAATDPSALLTFTPPTSGDYTLEVSYRGQTPDLTGVVTVAVLHKDGVVVPDANLYASIQSAFDSAHRWRRPRLRRLKLRAGWSYVALVLQPDQAHTMGDFLMASHDAVAIAAGDQTARNIDVSVLNQDSRTIAADARFGRASAVAYGAEGQHIRIKTVADDALGACLVSLLLLDAQ